MIIDLSLKYSEDYIVDYKRKSEILLNKIDDYINSDNILIVPINIFNIIEQNNKYIKCDENIFYDERIWCVGKIGDCEIYLDMFSKYNEICITYKKEHIRVNKIDCLVDDSNLLKEKTVKILT